MGSTEDQRTIWCGNLSDKVTEELLFELFLQAGPLERVRMPLDRDGRKSSYAFITFKHVVSVPYATQLLNGIALFDRKLNLKPRTPTQQQNTHQSIPQAKSLLPSPVSINEISNLLLLERHMMAASRAFTDMHNSYDHSSNRRDKINIAYKDDRRHDKPYGQTYRNRNQRDYHDHNAGRGNNQQSYYGNRRQRH